jgi:hypothetical protein
MEILTTIGVDAHSQVHVAAAVDPQGRVIAEHAVTANARELAEFSAGFKPCRLPVKSPSRAPRDTAGRSLNGWSVPERPSLTCPRPSPPRGGGGAVDQVRTTKATRS